MERSVVAIGNFDGVHLGHQALLREAVALAGDPVLAGVADEACGPLPVIVVTFWPHPLSVVAPARLPRLLGDLPSRIELLRAGGAHEVRVVPFTRPVADESPQAFVESVLSPLRPAVVVVGENFRFGRGAEGTPGGLAELGRGRFAVRPIGLVSVRGRTVSSSAVRAELAGGDVAGAAAMLGRFPQVSGVVQVGDQRGRAMGFPTANLSPPPGLAYPADGVYAGWLTRLDDPRRVGLPAAISVGANVTFDGDDTRVEAYVLDRDDLELYGSQIRLDFVQRLRGMVKFDGADALVAQVRADVGATRLALGQAV